MAAGGKDRSFNLNHYRYSSDSLSGSSADHLAAITTARKPRWSSGNSNTDRRQSNLPCKRPVAHQETDVDDGVNKRLRVDTASDSALCERCQALDFKRLYARDDIKIKTRLGRGDILQSFRSYERSRECGLCSILLDIGQQQATSVYDQNWCVEAYSMSRRLSTRFDRDVTLLTVRRERSTEKIMSFLLPMQQDDPETMGSRHIKSSIDWNIVKTWLSFCDEHHSKLCAKDLAFTTSGFRVIDCTTRRIVKPESGCQYVTLSYVWGRDASEPGVGNILPNDLPSTIEAAIETVKSLDYQYLWIDRYCIPQDNEQVKQNLIQDMGRIYENSVLTLIAVAGANPHYGLPGVGTCSRDPQKSIRINGQHYIVINFGQPAKELEKSTWNSRAWTYQEALLSRRKLLFTKEGLYFQCRSMVCHENLYIPLKSIHTKNVQEIKYSLDLPRLFPSRGVGKNPTDIVHCITAYSQRELKYDQDALDAFKGILNSFRGMKTPIRHIYGLPLFPSASFTEPGAESGEQLLFGLSWTMIGPAIRRKHHPSWTWLGWKTQESTTFSYGSLKGGKLSNKHFFPNPYISVETCDGSLYKWARYKKRHHVDDFKYSLPKYIHIRGRLFSIKLGQPGRADSWPTQPRSESTAIVDASVNSFIVLKDMMKMGTIKGFLLYYEPDFLRPIVSCLLLKSGEGTDIYERIGIAHLDMPHFDLILDQTHASRSFTIGSTDCENFETNFSFYHARLELSLDGARAG